MEPTGLLHVGGDAGIALAAHAVRPVDRRVGADLAGPFRVHLAEIVGEVEGGARTIGAMHGQDRGGWQVQLRVQRLDSRIIPLGDLAQKDLGQRLAVQHHLAGSNAGQVDDRHDGDDHLRELDQLIAHQFVVHQRLVGIGEVHGLGFDLLDAAARTDRLIIDLVATLLGVLGCPDLQHRVDGGSAGACQ